MLSGDGAAPPCSGEALRNEYLGKVAYIYKFHPLICFYSDLLRDLG